jgi:hypothetical protein
MEVKPELIAPESSLTSPLDRNREAKWRPNQGAPPLSEDEVSNAMSALNNESFTQKFSRVDRTYADPPVPLQNIALISFIPAKGATPDDMGVFGMAKVRGNFSTQMEADQRAEFIIRNADSYHTIHHAYVGRPFPITLSSKFSEETDEIDIRKATTSAVSSDIKQKKKDEQKEVNDIKNREEALREDVQKDEEDPYETYVTLKVKHAQLAWNYLEHQKKIAELKELIIKARHEVTELDKDHPAFQETYFQKYMDARKEAGIREETKEELKSNFMRFLVEDVPLPGIDDLPPSLESIPEESIL